MAIQPFYRQKRTINEQCVRIWKWLRCFDKYEHDYVLSTDEQSRSRLNMTPKSLEEKWGFYPLVDPKNIYGDFDFHAHEIDIAKFRSSLKSKNKCNSLIQKKLKITSAKNQPVLEDNLIKDLNDLLKMRDFHKFINANSYQQSLPKEIQELRKRLTSGDNTLIEHDYKKINRALLQVIYSSAIKKKPNLNFEYAPPKIQCSITEKFCPDFKQNCIHLHGVLLDSDNEDVYVMKWESKFAERHKLFLEINPYFKRTKIMKSIEEQLRLYMGTVSSAFSGKMLGDRRVNHLDNIAARYISHVLKNLGESKKTIMQVLRQQNLAGKRSDKDLTQWIADLKPPSRL